MKILDWLRGIWTTTYRSPMLPPRSIASVSRSKASIRQARRLPRRRVLTAERHPQADKLQVLTVDARRRPAPLTVVCGAPMRAPAWSACSATRRGGAANGMELKVAAVRGIQIERHDARRASWSWATIMTGSSNCHRRRWNTLCDYSGAGDPVIDVTRTGGTAWACAASR